MAEWLNEGAGRITEVGFASGSGVTVTAGAANTKGAYAQIVASAAHDAQMVVINVQQAGTTSTHLIDIALGASGSEQVVIPNLLMHGATSAGGGFNFFFPLMVPAGSRISARVQSATASTTVTMSVTLIETTWEQLPSFDSFVALGALTASSNGTVLGNPGSVNAFGAWTSLGSSTSSTSWLIPVIGNQVTTKTASQKFWWQVSIGATGSEQLIWPTMQQTSSSSTFGMGSFVGLPVRVPAGTQVNGRYGSSATTTLGMSMCVYGGVG